MIDAIQTLLILAGLLVFGVTFKKLFTSNQSEVSLIKAKVKEADEIQPAIEALKKESLRDTADFQDALTKYRAKYGKPRRPSDDPGV